LRESKIEGPVCEHARLLGFIDFKLNKTGRNGVADRLFLHWDRTIFFIEFKAPDEELRANQKRRRKEVENCGFRVFKIDNIEEGKELLTRIWREEIR